MHSPRPLLSRRSALAALACGLAPLTLSSGAMAAMPANSKPWVVGQSAPLSGVLADTGRDMVLGGHICFEEVNRLGGIRGRRVEHVVLDDAYEIDRTLANTRDLLDKRDAQVLFGYAGTGNVQRLLTDRVLAEAGVALVGPYTGGEPLRTPYNPNIFHVRAGYSDEIAVMVKLLTGGGVDRIAVMYQDDAFGQAGLKGVVDALRPAGLAPVVTAGYPKNTDDVAAAVKTIAAQQPQAVILVSITKSSAAFLKQYRAISKSAQIFNLSVVNPAAIAKAVGDDETRGFSITQVVPDPMSNSHEVAREYRTLLMRHGSGATPSVTSFEEFLAAKTLVEGLKRSKAYTRKGAMAGLESLQKFNLGGYTVNFGPNNRRGSNFVDVVSISRSGKVVR